MRQQQRGSEKAREVTPHQRSTVERVLFKLEDDLLLERVFDPPRGIYLRVGSMGEGSGFSLGPAFRYNTARFDFKASAAASTKTYFSGDVSLRFPGNRRSGRITSKSPRAVHRTARPASGTFRRRTSSVWDPTACSSNRSNFALRDTLGRVTGGYERGNFEAGIGLGYLDVSIGAGTDDQNAVVHRDLHGRRDARRERPRRISGDRAVCRVRDDRSRDRRSLRWSLSSVGDRVSGPHTRPVFVPPLGSGSPAIPDVRQGHTHDRDPCLDRLHHRGALATRFPSICNRRWAGGERCADIAPSAFETRTALLLQGEYRWRINQFVQGALFYDTGAVGSGLDDLGAFERSYGLGLRAGGRTGSAFRIEMAFGGREGNRLLVRFDDAF